MAEYSGSVTLISGITPKNNGTFPLVNAPDILVDADTDQRLDEAINNLQEETNEKLEVQFLDNLPTSSYSDNFSSINSDLFVAKNRCSLGLNSEDNETYVTVTTGSNAAAQYALATYDLSDYLKDDLSSCSIEFDIRMVTDTRMIISLADLNKRPGSSSGSTHARDGIAFRFGVINDAQYWYVNTLASSSTTYAGSTAWQDKWVHAKIKINVSEKKVSYNFKLRDDNTLLYSGGSDWCSILNGTDDGDYIPNGIEFYSWLNSTQVDIDNLELTANYDTNETTVYIVGNSTNGYTLYMYKDGEAISVDGGSSSSDVATDDNVTDMLTSIFGETEE